MEQLYPSIAEILNRSGQELKLGGIISEKRTEFDSSETTQYNWTYEIGDEKLRRLYEKGKTAQWNAATDLDWSTDVDLEKELFTVDPFLAEEPWFRKLNAREKTWFTVEMNVNNISQFLHGEQGALIATAQLVSAVPDTDAKFYAATQVMDEARHVEVFERYLREKVGRSYEITQNLFTLLQAISMESRWDFKFLGMQLLVEGLALTAFMSMLTRCRDPLLKQLLRLVMQDEARHVAYGVLSLRNFYREMNEKERRERQEFVFEAVSLMRDRLFSSKFYEKIGFKKEEVGDYLRRSPATKDFRNQLFINVVPNIKKTGLLDGFLKEKFAEIGILQYEDVDSEKLLNGFIFGGENAPKEGAA
ncbi:MAG: ferritin-like domain-containing protein [SAR324 cluster bacterium]|nr:ferritin-like domain-containing protein [SAR324 cluster bacterium]